MAKTPEEKAANFERIAIPRFDRVMKAIESLGNCASRSHYAYDKERVRNLLANIDAATGNIAEAFGFTGDEQPDPRPVVTELPPYTPPQEPRAFEEYKEKAAREHVNPGDPEYDVDDYVAYRLDLARGGRDGSAIQVYTDWVRQRRAENPNTPPPYARKP